MPSIILDWTKLPKTKGSVDNSLDYLDCCCLTLLKGLGNSPKNLINYQCNATSTKNTLWLLF